LRPCLLVAVLWAQALYLAILARFLGSLLLGTFASLLVQALLLAVLVLLQSLRLFRLRTLLKPAVRLRSTVLTKSRFPSLLGLLVLR
jgi:hypothetical protein